MQIKLVFIYIYITLFNILDLFSPISCMDTLLAVTRIIPRDGRGHDSHILFGFMYNHAKILREQVGKLLPKMSADMACNGRVGDGLMLNTIKSDIMLWALYSI